MIVTRLINNLKCLIGVCKNIDSKVTSIESAPDEPFRYAIAVVNQSTVNERQFTIEIPKGARVISVMIFRTSPSAYTAYETISISSYSKIEQAEADFLNVYTTGTNPDYVYEIRVTYQLSW